MTQPSIRRWPAVLLVSLGVIVSAGEPLSIRASKAQHGVPRGQEAIDAPDSPSAASGSTVINVSSTPLNSGILDNTTTTATINVHPDQHHERRRCERARTHQSHTRLGPRHVSHWSGRYHVQLATDVGGLNNDFGAGATDCTGVFTTFDDEAPVFIEASTAPFVGSFRPEGVAVGARRQTAQWKLDAPDHWTTPRGTLAAPLLGADDQAYRHWKCLYGQSMGARS